MNHRLACTLAVLVIIGTVGNFAHAERLAGPIESKVPDLNKTPLINNISSPPADRDQKDNSDKCEIVEKKCSNICSPSTYQWASVGQCIEDACKFVHEDCKEAVVHYVRGRK